MSTESTTSRITESTTSRITHYGLGATASVSPVCHSLDVRYVFGPSRYKGIGTDDLGRQPLSVKRLMDRPR